MTKLIENYIAITVVEPTTTWKLLYDMNAVWPTIRGIYLHFSFLTLQ